MNAACRRAVGPLVTLVAASLYVLAPPLRDAPPAPGALLLVTVLISTLLGGTLSGLVSGIVGIVCAAYALSESGTLLVMTPPNLFRLCLVTFFGLGIPVIVARIKARGERRLRREKAARARVETANHDLMVLHAAFDQVEHGVLVLDENLRTDFTNAAFRHMWALESDDAKLRPTFAELVERARHNGVHALPPFDAEAQDYVARRVALVQEGRDETIDLRLSNGRIVRIQCKLLDGGGRLVTYTDVTDLMRQAEVFERLATTDDLTGVFNRRHFMALAEREFADSRDGGCRLALLILDIDLFKSINDCFGHAVGDMVIRHVARVCREMKRTGDILARIGGEEFTLLLPATDIGEAAALAERINDHLAHNPVAVDGHELRVTVSLGVATTDTATTTVGDLMRRADQALYGAKRGGRNRVEQATAIPVTRANQIPSEAA
jgi:diguanylate cyclase (GGDEF)-like protein